MSAWKRATDEEISDDKSSNISFEEMYVTNRRLMMYTAMNILNRPTVATGWLQKNRHPEHPSRLSVAAAIW